MWRTGRLAREPVRVGRRVLAIGCLIACWLVAVHPAVAESADAVQRASLAGDATGTGAMPQCEQGPGLELIFDDFELGDLILWDEIVTPCSSGEQCQSVLRFFWLCQEATCVECVEDVDCLNNPTGLGPACSTGLCVCADDMECSANPAGIVCVPETSTCGCTTDEDCPFGGTCRFTPYTGTRTCF